jgi:uncharacterized RDD family membrane protein YckC
MSLHFIQKRLTGLKMKPKKEVILSTDHPDHELQFVEPERRFRKFIVDVVVIFFLAMAYAFYSKDHNWNFFLNQVATKILFIPTFINTFILTAFCYYLAFYSLFKTTIGGLFYSVRLRSQYGGAPSFKTIVYRETIGRIVGPIIGFVREWDECGQIPLAKTPFVVMLRMVFEHYEGRMPWDDLAETRLLYKPKPPSPKFKGRLVRH